MSSFMLLRVFAQKSALLLAAAHVKEQAGDFLRPSDLPQQHFARSAFT